MMGERLVMQESLFYEFRLEDHVASDHLLRRIDRFVDGSALRQHLAGFYSSMGRPSIGSVDPGGVRREERGRPGPWPRAVRCRRAERRWGSRPRPERRRTGTTGRRPG